MGGWVKGLFLTFEPGKRPKEKTEEKPVFVMHRHSIDSVTLSVPRTETNLNSKRIRTRGKRQADGSGLSLLGLFRLEEASGNKEGLG